MLQRPDDPKFEIPTVLSICLWANPKLALVPDTRYQAGPSADDLVVLTQLCTSQPQLLFLCPFSLFCFRFCMRSLYHSHSQRNSQLETLFLWHPSTQTIFKPIFMLYLPPILRKFALNSILLPAAADITCRPVSILSTLSLKLLIFLLLLLLLLRKMDFPELIPLAHH